MAHDLDRPIRSDASPKLYDYNPEIAYLEFSENSRFEIKPVYAANDSKHWKIRWISRRRSTRTYTQLLLYLRVIPYVWHIYGLIAVHPLPALLRDKAKGWANSLKHREITTWEDLIMKFMKKFFSPIENARRRQDMMLFKQRDKEKLQTRGTDSKGW